VCVCVCAYVCVSVCKSSCRATPFKLELVYSTQAVGIFRQLEAAEPNFGKKRLLSENIATFEAKVRLLGHCAAGDARFGSALQADERRPRQVGGAVALYTAAAGEYFAAVKLGGGEAAKKRLSLVLDRVEELKRMAAPAPAPALLPDLPAPPSFATSASPAARAAPPAPPAPATPANTQQQQPASGPSTKFSHDEMVVLRASSRINGKTFLPW
jgi:hypothetical protein